MNGCCCQLLFDLDVIIVRPISEVENRRKRNRRTSLMLGDVWEFTMIQCIVGGDVYIWVDEEE